MPRTRLNLAALRTRPTDAPPAAPPTLTSLMASEGALSLSRRQLLEMAGLAAVALPPMTRGLTPALLGTLEIVEQPGRLVLKLGGREKWVLDTRRFAGSSRLTVERSANAVRFTLTGARYPGTQLSADLQGELTRGLTGWRMKLRLPITGARAELPLESWLAGVEPASAQTRLSTTGFDLGATTVTLGGSAQVDYFPDGSLRLHGPDLVTFHHAGATLSASSLTVLLPDADSPSLLQHPPARRTELIIPREGRAWSFDRALAFAHEGSLTDHAQAFDVIQIETGETRGGRTVAGFVARDLSGAGRIAYQPGPGAQDTSGAPFALHLREPRYAVACDPAGDQRAFVADFAAQPQALRCAGCTLTFAADGPPFELLAQGDEVRQVRCEPALRSFTAPLSGALVETAYAEPGTRVSFISAASGTVLRPPIVRPQPTPTPAPAATPTPTTPPTGEVRVTPHGPITVVNLGPFSMPVIRPEDMLALTFSFVNLTFRAQAGQQGPHLERTKPGVPAFLVVEFPPQHIAEEALFETAAGYPIPSGDPDAGNNSSDTGAPQAPPLGSRLSGPSRLVFQIPDTVKTLPYTLPDLLDWSQLDLAVMPAALPPPIPARYERATDASGRTRLIPSGATAATLHSYAGSPVRSGLGQGATGYTPAPPTEHVAQANLEPGITIRPGLVNPGLAAGIIDEEFKVQRPGPEETALEAPYRLVISPSELAAWVHATLPVSHNGRVELWHTRLGVKGDSGTVYDTRYQYGWVSGAYKVQRLLGDDIFADLRTVRALWSPDYADTAPPHNNSPFRMSLDSHDRSELVKLTGDYKLADFRSRTVAARLLMLSSLGVWMNVRYGAEIPVGTGLSVEEWIHQATMARDQYVKVVYKGYLYPFGHRASLVKVTERKFLKVGNQNIAYLLQRMFIVVREPDRTYPAVGQPNDGRATPFRRVTLTTLVTPDLDPPEKSAFVIPVISAQAAFWPMVTGASGSADFQWHVVAEDWDGQRVEFTVPLVFVGVEANSGTGNAVAFDRFSMASLAMLYISPIYQARRTAQLQGQTVAYAESRKPGDTHLQTTSIVFGAEPDDTSHNLSPLDFEKANQPRGYPTIWQAAVRIPAAAAMAGAGGTVNITIHDSYIKHGMDPGGNPAEAFAKLDPASLLPVGFKPDQAGGLVTPNLNVSGLSRSFGPVGDIDNFAQGNFDPSKFFDSGALILGTIPLAKIIMALFGADQVPKLLTEKIADPTTGVPTAITTTLDWKPKLQSWPDANNAIFYVSGSSSLEIKAVLTVDLKQQSTTAQVDGTLSNVALNLIPAGGDPYFIQVNFNSLSFHGGTAQKVSVGCDLGAVNFGGPLAFINTLAKAIPLSGFNDPPILDVTPSGITVGYTLAIPSLGVGILSLQNIAVTAEVILSFLDTPLALKFAFCSREAPFLLTVTIFGGGGFVGTEIGLDKLHVVEASLEFGGNFSIDLGVASGGVYVMAGIYFKLADGNVTLDGYLRCGGNVSVMGIISISIEFYMGLEYQSSDGSVVGTASLSIDVSILFFSVSVTMTVRRQFAGSGSAWLDDGARLAALTGGPAGPLPSGIAMPRLFAPQAPPTFKDVMTPDDWAAYAAAFA